MMIINKLGSFKTTQKTNTTGKFFHQTLRKSSQFIYSNNASSLAQIEKFEKDTPKTIVAKAEKAKTAQEKWSKYPLDVRISHLEKFVSSFSQQVNELATYLTNETGKPISQAKSTI